MSSTQMDLAAFRVTDFRSVHDSGWIDVDLITAFVGTNEAGKTNLLLPLWKLNPAGDGPINILSDAPRKDYNAIRDAKQKPIFIRAHFNLSSALAQEITTLTGAPIKDVSVVEVSRDFDGKYEVIFPEASQPKAVVRKELLKLITTAHKEISEIDIADEPGKTIKEASLRALDDIITKTSNVADTVDKSEMSPLIETLSAALKSTAPNLLIAPRFEKIVSAVSALDISHPDESNEAAKLILDNMPNFVYYSTYGNLDAEIYLPHVIDDLKRSNLTGRAEARARTLRVLFNFVRLKPEEILALGRDHNEQNGRPSDEQIKVLTEKKKERSVLLQSASTDLTRKFRDWWKQGEYRFRFEADGSHFRIWVSDDKRSEEIELEGRSTGLQWFLSFYLIFLVESADAHNGSILLLDEPGHTLHPIAQRDLAIFFENLASSNQLLYTTHSPFLVNADHLDRVKAVFVNDAGYSAVSSNLRAGRTAAETKSVYPVHAAIGLSVSDTLLLGCKPIIVEGASDQTYMSAIKNFLIAIGKLNAPQELIFLGSSGVKGIKAIATILAGRDGDLPIVLCDGDAAGISLTTHLKEEMYAEHEDRVLLATQLIKLTSAEVEDFFPKSFMSDLIDRYLRGPQDDPFVADDTKALMPQVKGYATKNNIKLNDGWKVDIAKQVKARMEMAIATEPAIWKPFQEIWSVLFSKFTGTSATPSARKKTEAA